MVERVNKKRSRGREPAGRDLQLRVWGERRRDPDWDRFLAALVALALRRVEEDAERGRGGTDD